jgi:hypothetical protein
MNFIEKSVTWPAGAVAPGTSPLDYKVKPVPVSSGNNPVKTEPVVKPATSGSVHFPLRQGYKITDSYRRSLKIKLYYNIAPSGYNPGKEAVTKSSIVTHYIVARCAGHQQKTNKQNYYVLFCFHTAILSENEKN